MPSLPRFGPLKMRTAMGSPSCFRHLPYQNFSLFDAQGLDALCIDQPRGVSGAQRMPCDVHRSPDNMEVDQIGGRDRDLLAFVEAHSGQPRASTKARERVDEFARRQVEVALP